MTKSKNIDWQQIAAILIAILIVLIFGLWYWYNQSFLDTKNTFWATIDRNLQTGFVSKTTTQQEGKQTLIQQNNLQFRGVLLANNFVTIQDTTPGYESMVVTQTIGTVKADYLKYDRIEPINEQINTSAINVWSESNNQGGQPQILSESLVSSPLMFGYLSQSKRADLINEMQSKKVFNVDFDNVNKSEIINGKKVYKYKISINLATYLPIFAKYLESIGQNELAKQIKQSSASGNYEAMLYINYNSRQPVRLQSSQSEIYEEFSNFDLNRQVRPPENVKLNIMELQELLDR